MNRLATLLFFFGFVFAWISPASAAEDRRERVLKDKPEVEALGHWIYNDLPKGFSEAARTGRPLLVVLRCVP